MQNFDSPQFFLNDNNYADPDAKVLYLMERYQFRHLPNSEIYLIKNNLIVPIFLLFDYSLERLDMLNFLAEKNYVYDPLLSRSYVNEVASIKLETFQKFITLKELEFHYNEALSDFLEEIEPQIN